MLSSFTQRFPQMELTVTLAFIHDTALVLYVYLPNDEDGGEESVLTVRAFHVLQYRDH
jgi:hypothetical protein